MLAADAHDGPGPAGRGLVTGASAGIGRSYAEHLARTGHDLVIFARREEPLSTLAEELRATIPADVWGLP